MTAVWFVMVAAIVLGGLAVTWRFISVVLEVLREPPPGSMARPRATDTRAKDTRPRPAAGPSPHARQIVRTNSRPTDVETTDEGADLFARSRAAALGVRSSRPHVVADPRPAPAPMPDPAPDPASSRPGRSAPATAEDDHQGPCWSDLLAETLREFEGIHS